LPNLSSLFFLTHDVYINFEIKILETRIYFITESSFASLFTKEKYEVRISFSCVTAPWPSNEIFYQALQGVLKLENKARKRCGHGKRSNVEY